MNLIDKYSITNFSEYFNFVINNNVEEGDAILVCVTFRKKYLTDDERLLYDVPSNSFFNRKLIYVKDEKSNILKDRISREIDNLRVQEYFDRNGVLLPFKAIGIYIKLNPSSIKKSLIEATKKIFTSLLDDDTQKINKFQSVINTAFQKNDRIKNFIDIDVDIYSKNDESWFYSFIIDIHDNCKFIIVPSNKGYHIVIDKRTLCQSLLLHDRIKYFNSKMTHEKSEIEFNNGKLLPLNRML